MSVGVVMNLENSIAKKKGMGSQSTKDFYLESLKPVLGIMNLIPNAKTVSDVKQASYFSYSASIYASRVLGLLAMLGVLSIHCSPPGFISRLLPVSRLQ
jgi:hypothetical protein